MKRKFTDRFLRELPPREKRYDVWDVRGSFTMRISPSGHKAFYHVYRIGARSKGKIRRLHLGVYDPTGINGITLEQAYERLAKARLLISKNIDPQTEKKLRRYEPAWLGVSVRQMAREYLERIAKPNKKSWREDERILDTYVLPAIGARLAADITRRDLVLLLDDVQDRGAVMRNRVLSVISRCFRAGVERGILEHSPVQYIRKLEERPRERVLSEEEIRLFWHGIDAVTVPVVAVGLRFLLLTGQRRAEVAQAEWAEFDLSDRLWTIPAARSKIKHTHTLPIPELGMELLGQLRALGNDSDYVCAGLRGAAMHPDQFTRAVNRFYRKQKIERFVVHDLRRTASTFMRGLGNPIIVERVLGHMPPKIQRVYDRHTYVAEMAEIMQAWDYKLREICDLPDPTLTALPRRTKNNG